MGLKSEEPLVGHEVKVSVKVEEKRPLSEEGSESDAEKEEEGKEGNEKRSDTMVPVSRDVLVTFVDQSHVLFFTQFTPLFFKPGLSYVGQVRYKYSLFLCQNYAVINDIIMFLLYINNDLIIFILFISGSTETSRGRTSIEFRGERGDSQGQALHSIIRRSKRRETHSEAQTKLHRRIFIQGSQGRHQT